MYSRNAEPEVFIKVLYGYVDMYYFAVFKRRFSKLKANAKRKEEIIMEQKKKVYTEPL